MDINNLEMVGFLYLKYSNDYNGNPMASTNAFYGPWDSAEQFYDMLNDFFPNNKPEGALVAILETSTSRTGNEYVDNVDLYVYYNGALHEFGGSGENLYVKTIFAFKQSVNTPERPTSIFNLSNEGWSTNVPNSQPFWMSFAYYLIKDGNAILCDYSGLTTNATWSLPFEIGRGDGHNPTTIGLFSYNLSPDGIAIPVKKVGNNYITTNKALKEATRTKITAYYDGTFIDFTNNGSGSFALVLDDSSNNSISTLGLKLEKNQDCFWLSSSISNNDNYEINLGLNPSLGPVILLASMNASPINNGLIIQSYTFAESEESYKIECIPGIVVFDEYGDTTSSVDINVTKINFLGETENISISLNGNYSLKITSRPNTQNAEEIIVSSEPIQQETFENLRANAEAKTGDVFKIELYDNNTRNVISGAYDFLPIVSLARIAQSNGVITVGLINDSVTIPSYLTGENLSSAYLNQLKEKTIASLNISKSTNDIDIDYYKILGLTNSGLLTWNEGGTNLKNGFDYLLELPLDGNPHSCWLTQIDEDSLSAIAIHYEYKLSNEDNPRYGVEALNIEFNHGYVSYELKAFPDTAWLNSSGNAWETQELSLYLKQFTESGITRIDADYARNNTVPSSLSLTYTGVYSVELSNTYSVTVLLSNEASFSFNLSNNINNIPTTNLIGLNVKLYKNGAIEDYEYIDVVKMPASGSSESGESPYQLLIIKNSLVLIDDDSPNSNIKEASVTRFQLRYGNTLIDNFVVLPINNTVLFNTDSIDIDTENIPVLSVVQNTDSNNQPIANEYKLSLANENETFDGIYPLDGAVTYKVISVKNENVSDLDIIAEQRVLVRNFSSGEIYTLDLQPSVLYKDLYGNLLYESTDTTITPKVNIINQSQITTDTSGFYLKVYENSINNNNVIKLNNTAVQFSINLTIDFKNSPFSTQNCPSCYIVELCNNNDVLLDTQTVYFSIKGADGVVVDNNMVVSINNDAVIIDNDTESADLLTASQTTVLYNFVGEDITTDVLTAISGDHDLSSHDLYNILIGYEISNNTEGTGNNAPSLITVNLGSNNTYTYNWTAGNSLPKEQKTLQVTYWIKWDDTDTPRGQNETERTHMSSKTQVIQIKDFSNGAVYKLSATPNIIVKNPNTGECSEAHMIIADVTKIHKKVTSIASVKIGFGDGDVSLCVYPLSNTANKIYSGSIPSGVTISLDGWPKCVQNIFQNLDSGKKGIIIDDLQNPIEIDNGIQIEAVIWNGNTPIVVDSETVLVVTGGTNGANGQQGPAGPGNYLLTLDNDTVFVDDNIEDYTGRDESQKLTLLKQLSLCVPSLKLGVTSVLNVTYSFAWPQSLQPAKFYGTGALEFPFDVYYTDGNGDEQKFNSEYVSLNNFYLKFADSGNASDYLSDGDVFKLYVNAIVDSTIVETETMTIKVVNVSEDGSSYKLVLNNDKLYRDHDGNTLGAGFDNTVTAKLLKVTGSELFEYLGFNYNIDPLSNNANPGLYVFATAYYKNGDTDCSYNLDDDPFNIETGAYSNNALTFDCLGFRAATNANNGCVKIIIGAYYKQSNGDLITIDEETVSFVLKGEQGDPGVAGFYINMTNDSATIDNNSPKSVIEFATENKVLLYYNNVIVPITDYTLSTKFIDFEKKEDGWTISKGSVNDVADQKITFVNDLNEDLLILSLDSSTVDNSYIVKLTNNNELTYTTVHMPTGTAMVQYIFTVNSSVAGTLNSVVLTKILSIKIDEISEDGSIYRLLLNNDKLDIYYDGDNYSWWNNLSYTIRFTAVKYNENGEENIEFSQVQDNNITNAVNYIKIYAVCDEGYVWMRNVGYSDPLDMTYIDYNAFLLRGSNYGQTITNIRKYYAELYVNNKLIDTEVIDFSILNKAFEYVIEASPSAIVFTDAEKAAGSAVSKTVTFGFKKHLYNDNDYSNYHCLYKIQTIDNSGSALNVLNGEINDTQNNNTVTYTQNLNINDQYIEVFMYKPSDTQKLKPIKKLIVPISSPGPQGPRGLRGITIDPYYAPLEVGKEYTFYGDDTKDTYSRLSYLILPGKTVNNSFNIDFDDGDIETYHAYKCTTTHLMQISSTESGGQTVYQFKHKLPSASSYTNSSSTYNTLELLYNAIRGLSYWTDLDIDNLGDVYVNNLLATNAYIDNLTTNKLNAKEAWIDNLVSTKILAVDITTENIHVLNSITLGGKNIVTGGTITNGLSVIDIDDLTGTTIGNRSICLLDLANIGFNLFISNSNEQITTKYAYLPLPWYDMMLLTSFVNQGIIEKNLYRTSEGFYYEGTSDGDMTNAERIKVAKHIKYVDGFLGTTVILRCNTDKLFISGLLCKVRPNGQNANIDASPEHISSINNLYNYYIANESAYSGRSITNDEFILVLKCVADSNHDSTNNLSVVSKVYWTVEDYKCLNEHIYKNRLGNISTEFLNNYLDSDNVEENGVSLNILNSNGVISVDGDNLFTGSNS